ncbi:MAG: glutamine-hydrolyzing carbamoyl-phosphate synthase small subunit [Candidatus Methanofastidiosia archaeon]
MHADDELKAALVLRDGGVYLGKGYGKVGTYDGEAVFCTGMVGYTESMTDPSYHKQFLTFTYPLIGNYGVPSYDRKDHGLPTSFESDSIKARGIVAHEICKHPSHWSSSKNLATWLSDENVPGIDGIDTRSLTKRLRNEGVMPAILSVYDDDIDIEKIKGRLAHMGDPTNSNLVSDVSTPVTITYNDSGKKTVVVLDCGVKNGIIKSLVKRNIRVVKVRYNTPLDIIESYNPDGILISNGPGNPEKVDTIQDTINGAISNEIPIFGICMGIQLLSLSQGATTYKLKYGHRSQNQPCIERGTKRCYITSQNHGYVVDSDSLEGTGLDLWFSNANDNSCEGVISKRDKAFAVQFHPEACPGPRDTDHLFDKFYDMMAGI